MSCQVGDLPSKDKIATYLLKSKKNKKGLGVYMKDICSWPPIQFLPHLSRLDFIGDEIHTERREVCETQYFLI